MTKHWSNLRPIPELEYLSIEEELELFGITKTDFEKFMKQYNNLKVQAMIFDMDIDLEKFELVEKTKDETPIWLKQWRDKLNASDRRSYDYAG